MSKPGKPDGKARAQTAAVASRASKQIDRALIDAIRAGDGAEIVFLLEAGADVNCRSAAHLTALMIAAGLGHYHGVQLLLTAGADVHALDPQMGSSALHKAAQHGSPDVIGLLLDHGAFADQQTPILGNTPLIDAVLHKRAAAVGRLLLSGARTRIFNHGGQSALDIARADGLDAIAGQIKAHDDAIAERIAGLTLIAAVKAGDGAAVERSLAAGASPDEQMPIAGGADDNYTALGLAARGGDATIARLLLRNGADPGRIIASMGGMALHDATYFGQVDVVRMLTAAGLSSPGLAVQGVYNGMTALHDAVWHGHYDVARLLVEAGAPLGLRDHSGATPHDLARRHDYPKIADLLARAEQDRADKR